MILDQNRRIPASLKPSSSSYSYITKWGSQGSENGEFYNPYSIAVDSKGYVYVVDNTNFRIQVFASVK